MRCISSTIFPSLHSIAKIKMTENYRILIVEYIFKVKNHMVLFYEWGSTCSRLEPLQRGSLPFTTKFSEIPGTHFISLGKMSQPWSHPVVLNTRPLDWKSSTLTTRALCVCIYIYIYIYTYIYIFVYIYIYI